MGVMPKKGAMKKNILSGAALSALIFAQSTTGALALTTTASPTTMEQRIELRQENRQERRDQILENIANRVEERFTRHEERLQNWITRADKHIATLEAKGKDVTNAKKALETAKASLTTASQLGDAAVTALRAVTPENWTAQKADAIAARAAVKKAQVAYAQVIQDMKLALTEMKKAAK
jgi:hypothetical protein